MKKAVLVYLIAFSFSIVSGQIDVLVTGPDTLSVGQNAEYFVNITKYANRYFETDTMQSGFLNAGYGEEEFTGNFTYDFWVKPSRSIELKAEDCDNSGDNRISLKYSRQNWVVVPQVTGEGYTGTGVTVGTNGIMLAERSGCLLVSKLSYETPITSWSHIAVTWRPDSLFLFINGVLVRGKALNSQAERAASPVFAGSCYSDGFSGSFDEYRLWDTSLSQEDVKIIMDKKLLGHVNGLIYYASFDKGRFERTTGEAGEPYMTSAGFSASDRLPFSSWDLESYSGSGIFSLTHFDIHNISYLWSTGSSNPSIAYTPLGGDNTIFVKIYNPILSKNVHFSLIDSIHIYGKEAVSGPEEGLVAYYPLNGDARDESVYRNDGIIDGAAPATDLHGVAGKAMYFDGENDMIKINGALPVAGILSVSFLALSQNEALPGDILSDGGAGETGSTFMINFRGNDIGIRADKDAALNYDEVTDPALQNLNLDDKWVHVVWVMTPEYSKVYVNGVLKTTIFESGSNTGYHELFSYIGARQSASSVTNHFRGKLDELRIYNRELSDSEVETLSISYDVDKAVALYGYSEFSEIENSRINVYPNPASDYVVVETPDLDEFEEDMIRIVNLSGNTVYSTSFTAYTNQISVPGLSGQGMFILQVYSPSGIIKSSKKIIFQ